MNKEAFIKITIFFYVIERFRTYDKESGGAELK